MGGVNPAGNSSVRETRITPTQNPLREKPKPAETPDAERKLDLTLKHDPSPSRGLPEIRFKDGRRMPLIPEEPAPQTKLKLPFTPTFKGRVPGVQGPLPKRISDVI